MPYKSKAQQRLFHAMAERGEISKKTVTEFDKATERKRGGFSKLPERKHMAHGGKLAVIVAGMGHEHGREEEEHEELPEELVEAAEDILDVIDPYGVPTEREAREHETPLEKEEREISHRAAAEKRRAKAEVLAEALYDFFCISDAMPHEEGEHEEEGE